MPSFICIQFSKWFFRLDLANLVMLIHAPKLLDWTPAVCSTWDCPWWPRISTWNQMQPPPFWLALGSRCIHTFVHKQLIIKQFHWLSVCFLAPFKMLALSFKALHTCRGTHLRDHFSNAYTLIKMSPTGSAFANIFFPCFAWQQRIHKHSQMQHLCSGQRFLKNSWRPWPWIGQRVAQIPA